MQASVAGRATLTRWSISIAAVLLFAIGILHAVVNVRWIRRLIAGGEIAERFGIQMLANAAFGGAMLSLLGAVLLLVAWGRRGGRALWWIGVLVGLFLVAFGAAGYLLQPVPSVFLFSGLGALVCVPLLLWGRDGGA
jgi:hypothetical protein